MAPKRNEVTIESRYSRWMGTAEFLEWLDGCTTDGWTTSGLCIDWLRGRALEERWNIAMDRLPKRTCEDTGDVEVEVEIVSIQKIVVDE